MAIFRYHFLDFNNKKKKGKIEAETLFLAKEKLRQKGFCVLKIKELKGVRFFSFLRREKKICSRDVVISFTQQLKMLLASGMPLYESLVSLEERYGSENPGPMISSLAERIKEGKSFSDSLSAYPKFFSPFYRTMIISGESTGKLEDVLDRIISYMIKKEKFKKELISSMTYPLVLLVFSVGVIVFFLTFVVPSMRELFVDRELTIITRLVFWCSEVLNTFKYGFLGLVGGVVAFIAYCKKSLFIRLKLEKLILSLPFLRTLFLKFDLGLFSQILSSLLGGGIALVNAIKIARGSLSLNCLKEGFIKTEEQLICGKSLSQELRNYSFFPKLMLRIISLGETTGDLASSFDQIAVVYENDLQNTMKIIVTWAQPVILIFLGGLIGLIMLAILIPLTSSLSVL